VIFFVNLPIGLIGFILVLRRLPDYRGAQVPPLDVVGLVLFGAGVALLSYVLEIFGEHGWNPVVVAGLTALSAVLLLAYARHSGRVPHPLLRTGLLRIRTLRTAIGGSFLTRIGVGGLPFLLPLLYQVGLGYSPVVSGLLILPQSLAAMSLRATMPVLLRRLGYRKVLLSNTIAIGVLIVLFALVGPRTPLWVIAMQAFAFGFFSSFQYTSLGTLVYADVDDADASMAATLASTTQQLSMSFGVAAASLATALFIPDRFAAPPRVIVHGIHLACLVLGTATVLSAVLFRNLRRDDGAAVSQQQRAAPDVTG
jgi:Na+/melibiose symporter-like transporter